jgi:hypothetical protein
MNSNDLRGAAITLRKGELRRFEHALGRRIEALGGTLWVTLDHDPRDFVLNAGEGVDVDGSGDALVSALDDARFVLLEPVPPLAR